MNWLHRIAAMLLLASWMPAASLCLAECAGFVERGDCCPHESGDSTGSACCLLASGHFKPDNQRPVVVAPVLLTGTLPPSLLIPPPVTASASPPSPDASPPDLPVTWQFLFRTALPPRAPSLAS